MTHLPPVEYYLYLDDERKGPYTLRQVQSMWHTGRLTGQTLYWKEGFAEWMPLESILRVLEPPRSSSQRRKDDGNSAAATTSMALWSFILHFLLPFALGVAALAAYQWFVLGRFSTTGQKSTPVAVRADILPTPEPTDSPSGFEGSAETLYREYAGNEVASDRRYVGKPATVTGTVTDIGKDILEHPYLVLASTGPQDGVQCIFARADPSLDNIQKGTFVTVHGRVKGKATRVLLENCIVP